MGKCTTPKSPTLMSGLLLTKYCHLKPTAFRGSIGTVISNMFTLGCLYTYVSSYFIASWRTVAWLQLVPCALLGLATFFAPNSPYWLVERGREEEARKSLRILRGPDYNLEEELAEIVAKKRAKELTGKSVGSTLVSGTFWRPFLRCIA